MKERQKGKPPGNSTTLNFFRNVSRLQTAKTKAVCDDLNSSENEWISH